MTSKQKKPSTSEPEARKIKLVGLLKNPTQQDFEELARRLKEESENTPPTN